MTAEPERRGYNSSRERVQFTAGNIQSKSKDEGGLFRRNSSSGLKDIGQPERRITRGDKKLIEEENRLLGSKSGSDPRAVPIPVPGFHSPQRNKSILKGAFKPLNTLTYGNHARPQNLKSSPTSLTRKRESIPVDHSIENDGSPRKRQKTETQAVIDIDDDDVIEDSPLGSPEVRPQRFGNQVQRIKGNPTKNDGPSTAALNSSKIAAHDEEFPRNARNERIERNKMENSLGKQPHGFEKCSVMSRVEVPGRKPPKPPASDGKEKKRNSRDVQTDRQPQPYNRDSTESPDELQGDKTVGESWKMGSKDGRQLSPSNIRHGTLSSPKKKKKKKDSNKKIFKCMMFRCGVFLLDEPHCIAVDENLNFSIRPRDGLRKPDQHNFKEAIKILYSTGEDNAKVRLHFPNARRPEGTVDIEFSEGSERVNFCQFLKREAPSIKEFPKESGWMDKAFDKASHPPGAGPSDDLNNPPSKQARESKIVESSEFAEPKRKKLAAEMLDQDGTTSSKLAQLPDRKSQAKNTSKHSKGNKKKQTLSEFLSHSHPTVSYSDDEATIPVKPYQEPTRKMRETRSSLKSRNVLIESDGEDGPPLSPVKIKNGIWTKPLVYPKTGRKKAEISVHDLERLRDNEFLNDNIIGFYMRFLEHHLEQQHTEVSKRVYFFNSYFFATLTNSPRGSKRINYQGVEKWTRAINIFNYDYIVVPINENAHWYVAIICNLPNLLRPDTEEASNPEVKNASESEEKDGLPAIASPDDAIGDSETTPLGNGKEHKLQDSFVSMTLSDTAPPSSSHPDHTGATAHTEDSNDANNDEWPDGDENEKVSHAFSKDTVQDVQASQPQQAEEKPQPKPTKKRGKKARRALPKYDPRQPTIITFDSLSCARSPTIKILREYLEEEAKSKQSLDIDSKLIKGMNAQQIPRQSNFSDCGLYLLAYLEKFVQDPDNFIYKLLRREMNEYDDWPEMKPGLFRRRLRDFLFSLYQERISQDQIEQPEQQLLVDKNPLNILLVEGSKNRDNGEDKCVTPDRNVTTPKRPAPESAQSAERKRKEKPISDSPARQMTPVRSSPRFNRGAEGTGQSSPSVIIGDGPVHKPARKSTPMRSSPRVDQNANDTRASTPSTILGDSPVRSSQPMLLDGILDFLKPAANASPPPQGRVEVPGTPPPTEQRQPPKDTNVDTTIISSSSQP